MAPKVLILDMNADNYRERLARRFPAVAFHATHDAKDAEKDEPGEGDGPSSP